MRGLIGLVSGRFLGRDGKVPELSGRLMAAGGLGLLASGFAAWAEVQHIAPLVGVFISSLALLAGFCIRTFRPTIAVSVIGVALGVASLFTVLSVTSGFERELTARVARLSGHVLVTKYGLDFTEYERLAAEWEADPQVVMASPFVWGSAALVLETQGEAEREPTIVIVKGVDPEHAQRSSLLSECVAGGDLPASLRPANPGVDPGIVLGHRLAARLGVGIGERVVLVSPEALDGTGLANGGPPGRAQFEVRDLLETGVSEFDSDLVLVHLTGAQALLFGKGRVSGIELELADPSLANEFAARTDGLLNEGRRLPLFRAGSWEQYSQSTLVVIRQVRTVVSVVLGLMVLVAGSSLVASLLLLVRRKQTQIAVLSALGADRRRIFWAFETTGLLTGVYGAGLGLLLGGLYGAVLVLFPFPLDSGVYPLDHLPVAFSPADALVPALMAVVICALVSGPLAYSASRVRPIDVLRR
jgi:lipoprotein-releasing system permease protein